jgi:cadmium resistance transport/sequestration family protein
MNGVLHVTIAGISAFAATNIDDIIILMFFFSQVNAKFRIRDIIIGQYLGFTTLILLSLPGFFGGMIIPKTWIGLLGFVPIGIGLQQLFNSDDDESEIQTVSDQINQHSIRFPFSHILTPQTYSVAAITFANGGDNIGIYVPFFASLNLSSLLIVLTIFFILVGVWCAIAYGLSRHQLIGKLINTYGKKLVPYVLIGLGLFILWDSHSYELLPSLK